MRVNRYHIIKSLRILMLVGGNTNMLVCAPGVPEFSDGSRRRCDCGHQREATRFYHRRDNGR